MMSSSAGTAPGGSGAFPFDLLKPIVRSKRTPIACTECRRRQVKCSGKRPRCERCERCEKRDIVCEYVPLSEQRATGASISRSGTPQVPHTSSTLPGHSHGQSSRFATPSSEWQPGAQGYRYNPDTAAYPASEWRPTSPMPAQYGRHAGARANQSYAGMNYNYPAVYDPHTQFVPGGGGIEGASAIHTQGYTTQGYASGTSYGTNHPYGNDAVVAPNLSYADTSQMAGIHHQHSAAYIDQYGQQTFIDEATGQIYSADVASQWINNDSHCPGFQDYTEQN